MLTLQSPQDDEDGLKMIWGHSAMCSRYWDRQLSVVALDSRRQLLARMLPGLCPIAKRTQYNVLRVSCDPSTACVHSLGIYCSIVCQFGLDTSSSQTLDQLRKPSNGVCMSRKWLCWLQNLSRLPSNCQQVCKLKSLLDWKKNGWNAVWLSGRQSLSSRYAWQPLAITPAWCSNVHLRCFKLACVSHRGSPSSILSLKLRPKLQSFPTSTAGYCRHPCYEGCALNKTDVWGMALAQSHCSPMRREKDLWVSDLLPDSISLSTSPTCSVQVA